MDLTAWLRINRLGLQRGRPILAPATKGSRSDALAPDSTTGLMPPSPPSLTPSGTPNGPVAPSLSSVIEELIVVAEILLQESGRVPEGYLVDAFKWLDATLALAAEPAPSSASTSAKQDSPPSAQALTLAASGCRCLSFPGYSVANGCLIHGPVSQ